MSTPISSSALAWAVARAGRFALAGAGRRAAALAVPLLAAGVLAAGCGSAHTAGPDAAAAHAAAPATAGSATPVPTVSGGQVVAGQPACVGWPTDATSVSLPVSFVPVSVERCVNGAQTIPGKGLWTTSTLQRADSGLAALINALRQPAVAHRPGTVCPALAIIPPQVVLIGADGKKLIPRLPVTGCGLIQSRVLAALDGLHWQTVSVRLIAKVQGATTPTVNGTVPTVPGSTPHSMQTVGAAVPR